MSTDPALVKYMKMFLKSSDAKAYPKDSVIFKQGDAGDLYYVVLDGAVRIEIAGVPVRLVEPGEAFGETALLDGGPRTATAIAEQDCRLYPIGAKRFDEMVEETPHFLQPMLLTTLKRLRAAEQRIVELTNARPAA